MADSSPPPTSGRNKLRKPSPAPAPSPAPDPKEIAKGLIEGELKKRSPQKTSGWHWFLEWVSRTFGSSGRSTSSSSGGEAMGGPADSYSSAPAQQEPGYGEGFTQGFLRGFEQGQRLAPGELSVQEQLGTLSTKLQEQVLAELHELVKAPPYEKPYTRGLLPETRAVLAPEPSSETAGKPTGPKPEPKPEPAEKSPAPKPEPEMTEVPPGLGSLDIASLFNRSAPAEAGSLNDPAQTTQGVGPLSRAQTLVDPSDLATAFSGVPSGQDGRSFSPSGDGETPLSPLSSVGNLSPRVSVESLLPPFDRSMAQTRSQASASEPGPAAKTSATQARPHAKGPGGGR